MNGSWVAYDRADRSTWPTPGAEVVVCCRLSTRAPLFWAITWANEDPDDPSATAADWWEKDVHKASSGEGFVAWRPIDAASDAPADLLDEATRQLTEARR